MKKINDMQRLRGHLEKNWGLRIEYLKYQIYDLYNSRSYLTFRQLIVVGV